MSSDIHDLKQKAKKVLENNWMGTYTRPSSLLYPHQWSWDSGFMAIGYSTYDQEKAQLELSSLFEAQWRNGMVPHIVFDPDITGEYFPDIEFWEASRSKNLPSGHYTSGIIQPPVHAIAALSIYKRAEDRKSAKTFLEEIYPKLVASHQFFHRERDPKNEGLVYIRHPWESGIDNSPTWDVPLKKIALENIPTYERKDLKKGVSAEQRPSDRDYDRYIYLVDLFKKCNYDEVKMFRKCPFLVQDVLLNSIIVKANQDLAKIGEILGKDTSEVKKWEAKTKEAINRKLWHRGHSFYDCYDLKGEELIEVDTAAGFSALYSGVASESQAQELYNYLDSKSFCSMHHKRCFSIPNYDMEGEYFDPANYWRGPVWINMNWMLSEGLRRYGFEDKAKSVKQDIVELVRRNGFCEYFDPIKGEGYGSKEFSWSAALFLDCIYEQK